MAKRRRRGVMLVLLLALVLLLGLWGGGFLDGGGGGGRPRRAEDQTADRTHEVGARRGDSDLRVSRNDIDAELAGMPGAAPSGAGSVAGGPDGDGPGAGTPSGRGDGDSRPKTPEVSGSPGSESVPHEDRVRGLYRIVQDTATTRFFGEGLQALDQLDALPLDEKWQGILADARTALRGRLAGHLDDLAKRVDAGDAFGARELLRPLLRAPHEALAVALAEQAAAKGWIPFDRALRQGADLPSPGPLDAQRVVDLRLDVGGAVRARVVQSRADGVVVLKIRNGSGITYPRVARAQLAPVSARPDEMLDQGLAAFAAGEVPLGLIWTAAAVSRGLQSEALDRVRAAFAK